LQPTCHRCRARHRAAVPCVCLQEAKLADDKLAELLDDDPYTAHGMVEPNPTG